MSKALVGRFRLEQDIVLAICLWLGLGPFAAAATLWEEVPDCCCGGGSACLLGGCNCGEYGDRDTSPCGGLRPSKDADGDATTLSFVRDLGVGDFKEGGIIVEIVGHSLSGATFSPEIAPPAPEPPPPRSASAC